MKYEYKVKELGIWGTEFEKELEKELNNMTKEGWELVETIRNDNVTGIFIFRRKK